MCNNREIDSNHSIYHSLHMHTFWDTIAMLVRHAPKIASKCQGEEKERGASSETEETAC